MPSWAIAWNQFGQMIDREAEVVHRVTTSVARRLVIEVQMAVAGSGARSVVARSISSIGSSPQMVTSSR